MAKSQPGPWAYLQGKSICVNALAIAGKLSLGVRGLCANKGKVGLSNELNQRRLKGQWTWLVTGVQTPAGGI